MSQSTQTDPAKLAASRAAVALVQDGMKLGLGTGSTASIMVEVLAERVRNEGLSLRMAATSRATAELAESLGLKIESLDELGWLDMTIDGADEVDPDLHLIKGGGGRASARKGRGSRQRSYGRDRRSGQGRRSVGGFPAAGRSAAIRVRIQPQADPAGAAQA